MFSFLNNRRCACDMSTCNRFEMRCQSLRACFLVGIMKRNFLQSSLFPSREMCPGSTDNNFLLCEAKWKTNVNGHAIQICHTKILYMLYTCNECVYVWYVHAFLYEIYIMKITVVTTGLRGFVNWVYYLNLKCYQEACDFG